MDEKLKAKWIKALRSGKYKQVRETLKGNNFDYRDGTVTGDVGYCCLGVLCDIAPGIVFEDSNFNPVVKNKKMVELFEKPKDNTWGDSEDYYFKEDGAVVVTASMLPSALEKLWGLDKRVQFKGKPMCLQNKLAEMNDAGESFDEIANYLERINF